MAGDTGPAFIGFTSKQATRIANAVKKVEGTKQSELGSPGNYSGGVGTVLKGKLTSDLVYDTDNDPKTWSATFQVWYPDTPEDDTSVEAEQDDYDTLEVWSWGLPDKTTLSSGTEIVCCFINGRWYVVEAGQQTIVRFELTADLLYARDYGTNEDTGSEGSQEGQSEDDEDGNAVILIYADGGYEQSDNVITVVDMTVSGDYGTWSGLGATEDNPGYQGFAIYRADRKAYEILWMERQARYIQFQLDDALLVSDESSDDAQVLDFWEGRNPDPDSEGLTVYNLSSDDDSAYQFYGLESAIGYAVLEETPGSATGQYNIIRLETPAKKIHFTLTAPVTYSSYWQSEGATVNAWFDGQNPDPETEGVTVYDTELLFQNCPTGAKGKAIYNEKTQQYEIITCQHLAMFIQGSISGTLTAGSSQTCYVSIGWQGLLPNDSTATVYDNGKFSTTVSNKQFQATFDKENNKYRFTWVDC